VVCDRCGVRPEPQGRLPSDEWGVGQPHDGLWCRPEFTAGIRRRGATPWTPGRGPGEPTGTLGGELVLGRTSGLFRAEVKVGNAGSERVLAGHLRVWPTAKGDTWAAEQHQDNADEACETLEAGRCGRNSRRA
jgi:hypothetical protein